jgi:ribosomal protein L37AE/L43A
MPKINLFLSFSLILSLFICLFVWAYKLPRFKGWFGEMVLHLFLKFKLNSFIYIALRDIVLPTDDGTTTQIDHILVSRYGVFVIETKNYNGWIYGDAHQRQWTQVFYRKKFQFQNPVHQNYKHIMTLVENTRIPVEYFKSVIAFSGRAKFKTEMPDGVMHFYDVPNWILQHSVIQIIRDEQIPEIVQAIREWDASVDVARRQNHVENLKRRHQTGTLPRYPEKEPEKTQDEKPEAAPICPKCGAEMVFREKKDGSGSFWGCASFPKCRGVMAAPPPAPTTIQTSA